jgi:predicted ArsR family transcriptional regulator
MDIQALLATNAGPPPGQNRARVLDLLRTAGSPLGVHEVADRTGLHPSTARFHLDKLVEAGLATRERQARATPGRPAMAYCGAGGGLSGERRYRLLAEMLTTLITGMMPDPGQAAMEAGREWGAYLTEQSPPYQRPSAGEAIERLTAIMDKLGFAPQADADGRQYRLGLHQCPFREVAQQHQDVVCSLHLRLMQGALAQMRAPLTADRLDAFTERSLCTAHLTARHGPGPQAAARRYSLTAGRMRNWQRRTCSLIRRTAGRPCLQRRRSLAGELRCPSAAPSETVTGQPAAHPRRYSREDRCANTAAAKPWPPSAN